MAYTFWVGQWDLGLFLSGLTLAEMQFIREDPACPLFTTLARFVPNILQRNKNMVLHILTIGMVLVAIHFLCFPDLSASSTPGYEHMISWTPPIYGSVNLTQRFWLCLGSIILVWALCLSPPSSRHDAIPLLQKVFNHPFSQYLANISYALYVTHALVLWSVGGRLLSHWNVAVVTSGQYLIGFLISAVVNSVLCFWMSDLFWRGVDAKSVEFAKWVADRCFVE